MTASGLVHMGARLYDPALGRFLSRDPLPGDLENPQSQTPYAYGLNNPLRFQDLDGRAATSIGAAPAPGDPTMGKGCLGGESPGAEKHSIGDWIADGFDTVTWNLTRKAFGVCGNGIAEQHKVLYGVVGLLGAGKFKKAAEAFRAANAALRTSNAARYGAKNERLGNALADDYRRVRRPIGDGSALDAAKYSVRTGNLVGGSDHLAKAVQMRNRYARMLRSGQLHDAADQRIALERYHAYRDFVTQNNLDEMMKRMGY